MSEKPKDSQSMKPVVQGVQPPKEPSVPPKAFSSPAVSAPSPAKPQEPSHPPPPSLERFTSLFAGWLEDLQAELPPPDQQSAMNFIEANRERLVKNLYGRIYAK